MNKTELSELIIKNTARLKDESFYKNILACDNNLIRYNLISKLCIIIQNENAKDIKTEDEWGIKGRKVTDGEKPMYIILPRYKYKYVDAETRDDLTNSDLSSDELVKAVKYSIVDKEETIDGVFTTPLYDIKQTYAVQAGYNISKPILNIEEILGIFHEYTEYDIQQADRNSIDSANKILYVSKSSYSDLAKFITIALSQYCYSEIASEIEQNFDSIHLELLKNSIKYSISTLLRCKYSSEIHFNNLDKANLDAVLTILNVCNSIVQSIIPYIEFSDNSIKENEHDSIIKLKKAEIILDIMEANNIYNIMKGM